MATSFIIPEQIKNYIFSGNKLFVQLAANYLYKEKGMHINEVQEYINTLGDNIFIYKDMIIGKTRQVGMTQRWVGSPVISFVYSKVFDGDFYKFKLVDNNIEIL